MFSMVISVILEVISVISGNRVTLYGPAYPIKPLVIASNVTGPDYNQFTPTVFMFGCNPNLAATTVKNYNNSETFSYVTQRIPLNNIINMREKIQFIISDVFHTNCVCSICKLRQTL